MSKASTPAAIAAAQQQAWLEATLEAVGCAVITASPTGHVTYLNSAARELLGLNREEAFGGTMAALIHIAPAVDLTGGDDRPVQGTLETPAGPIPIEGTLRSLHDASGTRLGRALTLRDISARLRAQDEAHQQNAYLREHHKLEALGRLAVGIAHDFNNLLTAITGYSELVAELLDPSHPACEHIAEISAAGDRAVELTRQLLAFSRRQPLDPRILNLNELLEGMEKLLQRLTGERVEVAIAADPDLGMIRADPAQIEQVVLNLVVNARDAMPDGGRILIETANIDLNSVEKRHPEVRAGPYVMISVQDTGTGMSDEILAHLFDPFFSTKGEGQGTGLGLAIVYGIVKQSDGDIWVDSAMGQGSRFRIYLPRADEPATAPPPVSVPRILGGSETILVVEDETITRTLIRWALTRYGYTVLEAGHPGEALLIAEQHDGPLHLVLSDVVMPRLNGPELVQRLALRDPDLRVLYISAYSPEEVLRYGIDVEASGNFLAKPFTPGALAHKVRQVLDRSAPSVRRRIGEL